MKKPYLLPFVSCLIFMVFQCEEDSIPTMEYEQNTLIASKKIIEDLAASSFCNESTECKFIAFGSKPCGEPWSYLIYSTSIDTTELEGLVEVFNQNEDAFNKKWDVVSDCSAALPPTSVNCENNTCIPVYQN
ncbi:hypothetical protein V8G56_01745 [Gaetbulibacter aquiaggeris]|uniref:Uncharacterized protein n=1 Tax=Gaetbulibacter aquiaggeris TaxID=1735373 RepID=A0ABW7MLB9_9FLAO